MVDKIHSQRKNTKKSITKFGDRKKKKMQTIVGKDRHQMIFTSLEQEISKDNPVRLIDAFVEKIDLKALGIKWKEENQEGRPSYDAKVFLKLYMYGYFNGLRSSRRLEKESKRNVELRWLIKDLQPNYHSIADFRKINAQGLQKLFKLYVIFIKECGLISGKVVAVDGSKFRASNSKKNNYNEKKIERHLKYIDEKTAAYLQELEANDIKECQSEKIDKIEEQLNRLKRSKLRYELLSKELAESGEPQISTTDKEARALLVQGQVVEVSYNMEAAVDAQHNLVIATHVINRNDRNALYEISKEAKENIGAETLTILADKGFHNGGQIEKCKSEKIETIIAEPEKTNSNGHGTTQAYMVDKFIYNKEDDTYTCPQGETLKTQGTWHKKTRERDSYKIKKYRTPKCKGCAVKHLCTGRQKGGREIERSEYAQAVLENRERYEQNKELYKRRQMMNEHIFGTIKRKWHYNYTDLRGLEKVNGEVSLIMTIYNFKRTIKILGFEDLMEKLKNWEPKYPTWPFSSKNKAITSHYMHHFFEQQKLAA